MRDRWDLVVITNDIYTKEDQRLLTVAGALAAERIMGVETGGCPHTAIREDASINLEAIDRMLARLSRRRHRVRRDAAATTSPPPSAPSCSDLTIYVIDVAAGEKIPRKGGPGITKSDLFVINKTDLAPYVGADLGVMGADTLRMRERQAVRDDQPEDPGRAGRGGGLHRAARHARRTEPRFLSFFRARSRP